MNSDDDQPMVMTVVVGFSPREELTVAVELTDYENHANDCATAAVVNVSDARQMARRNGVDYFELPAFIAGCMESWREWVNPDFKQTLDCFKEITDCLLDEGCRFSIRRTYGRGGHACDVPNRE